MSEDETPILRADATDDDLQEEPGTRKSRDKPRETDKPSDTVEPPAPKRQVPVVLDGVFHGMREVDP